MEQSTSTLARSECETPQIGVIMSQQNNISVLDAALEEARRRGLPTDWTVKLNVSRRVSSVGYCQMWCGTAIII